ncbi:hypothetical protein [Streptomyces sp. GbtcB7]|uniref:hypothetical protein n=1 Tax=Streptomyces sp. GbtcB7 TaxID=2824752 RepID=UPI0020C611CB|nr:hypothetical protein [Streptomyces sp. GbtcB7]
MSLSGPDPSDLDQQALLHSLADRLGSVADRLPLPDQIRLDPGVSEILDDEIRHLAGLLGYLAGEHARLHRAAANYPSRLTVTGRRTALALASAAEPTGAALAALGHAVHHLGHLADLAHQPPSPAHARSTAAVHQGLTNCMREVRMLLARAAKDLRTAADTRTAPHAAPPYPAPAASAATSRTR